MSSKAWIGGIVKAHFDTLINPKRRGCRRWLGDIAQFVGIPVVLGVAAWKWHWRISGSNLLTAVSILAALSISAAIYVFELRVSTQARLVNDRARSTVLLDQLFTNLLYSVLVGFLLIAIMLFNPYGPIWNAILVAIAAHYLLTMLMCMKRLFAAFQFATGKRK